jgi:hypothetical protein
MRHTKRFRPELNDTLEDRTVPSHLLGGFWSSQVGALLGGFGRHVGQVLRGDLGFGGGRDFGGFGLPGRSGASSTTLSQDARSVQRAFQTFNASYQAAVASLRQSATTKAGPTQAGLDSYNGAVASAISNLNSAISSSLGNLNNSGGTLLATIKGFTSTLQTELQSAGSGLANSTNQAVRALRQEANSDIRIAQSQATSAILNTQPTGVITSTAQQTYNQAVNTATQTFKLAISNAVQSSISGSAPLDNSAVSSAVSTLQTGLISAIDALGTPFTSSTFNPTSAVATQLTTLQNQLLAIVAPTAGNSASTWLFSRTVSSVVSQNLRAINLAVSTSIQNYNNSLV